MNTYPSPEGDTLVNDNPAVSSPDSSLRSPRTPRKSRFPLMTILGLVIMLASVTAGLFLIRLPQDIRNRAFTGFVSRFGGETTDVVSELRFAQPEDVPQNPQYVTEDGQRGSFYAYAQKFVNNRPEYQEIPLPEFLMYGQVFLVFDQAADTSTFFARISGFPEEEVGETSRLWIEMTDGSMRLLGNIDIEIEDEIPVAYVTYLGPGNLKQDAVALHFSQDTEESDLLQEPGFILLSVKM